MTVDELSKKLDEITDSFSSQIRSEYPENSKNPVDEEDINALAKQVFYAMRSFKEEIIAYLKQAE